MDPQIWGTISVYVSVCTLVRQAARRRVDRRHRVDKPVRKCQNIFIFIPTFLCFFALIQAVFFLEMILRS